MKQTSNTRDIKRESPRLNDYKNFVEERVTKVRVQIFITYQIIKLIIKNHNIPYYTHLPTY